MNDNAVYCATFICILFEEGSLLDSIVYFVGRVAVKVIC